MLARKANPHGKYAYRSHGVVPLNEGQDPTEKIRVFTEKDFNRMIRRNRNFVGILLPILSSLYYFLPDIVRQLLGG